VLFQKKNNVNNILTVLNHILLRSDAILSGKQVSILWRNLLPLFSVSYSITYLSLDDIDISFRNIVF
jgi:hypothetical protein